MDLNLGCVAERVVYEVEPRGECVTEGQYGFWIWLHGVVEGGLRYGSVRYVVMGEAVFYRVFVCFTECIMRKGWVGLEGGYRAVGRGEEHEEGVQQSG